MSGLLDDARAALRSLVKAPRYAALTITCLALGVGGTATMYAVTATLFLRAPSGIAAPSGVRRLYFNQTVPVIGNMTTDLTSYSLFTDLRANQKAFGGLTAYYMTKVSEGRGPSATMLRTSLVSRNYFDLLGVRAAPGRVFADSDEPGSQTAIVSDALWASRFGRNPRAIGASLLIADRVYTIVGVADRGFSGVDVESVDVWLPLDIAANDLIMPRYTSIRGAMALSLLGRIASTSTTVSAAEDITQVLRNVTRGTPMFDSTRKAIVAPLLRDLGPKPSEQARVSLWLMGVSIAVLLIAAVNCANLMLLRAMKRERDLAVRIALGASHGQVARLLLFESIYVSVGSALAAVGLAVVGTVLVQDLLLTADATANLISLPRLFAFSLLSALVIGGCATYLPLRRVSRADFGRTLRVSAQSALNTRHPLRTVLLAAQLAIAMILLVGAGVFIKSLRNVRALDLGFAPTNVLAANVDFAGMASRAANAAAPDSLYTQLMLAVETVPGVASVAITSSVPFQYVAAVPIAIPDRDPNLLPKQPAFLIVASEHYLTTIGLRLVDGHWFGAADYDSGSTNVVINQSLAHIYWPGESALGKCLIAGPQRDCRTVVGVVADTRQTRLQEERRAQLYFPTIADPKASARLPRTLVVRSSRGLGIANDVKRAIQSADPSLPFIQVESLDNIIAPKMRPWLLGSRVFSLFGVLALLLAAFGLYGAISSSVTERTHEFGVRTALGASAANVAMLVLRQVLLVSVSGIAVGVGISLVLGQRVQSLLFDQSARDLSILTIAAATLVCATLAACFVPVWRAVRADPIRALRSE